MALEALHAVTADFSRKSFVTDAKIGQEILFDLSLGAFCRVFDGDLEIGGWSPTGASTAR